MICKRCQWDYPDHFLSPVAAVDVGELTYSEPVCAICALKMINEAMGVSRTTFDGERAEALRQAALKWRRTHPRS